MDCVSYFMLMKTFVCYGERKVTWHSLKSLLTLTGLHLPLLRGW